MNPKEINMVNVGGSGEPKGRERAKCGGGVEGERRHRN